MRITHEAVRPYASRLKYETAMPPRSAVLALFTLTPKPIEVLSVASWESSGHRGTVSWTLVAQEEGGLTVVRAEADGGDTDGAGQVESARWHPASHLRSVSVTDIKTIHEPVQYGDYVGRLSWVVEIEGEDDLILPTPADGNTDRIEAFCRHIQSVLGAPRDE